MWASEDSRERKVCRGLQEGAASPLPREELTHRPRTGSTCAERSSLQNGLSHQLVLNFARDKTSAGIYMAHVNTWSAEKASQETS